jgi:hypothetical protein
MHAFASHLSHASSLTAIRLLLSPLGSTRAFAKLWQTIWEHMSAELLDKISPAFHSATAHARNKTTHALPSMQGEYLERQ